MAKELLRKITNELKETSAEKNIAYILAGFSLLKFKDKEVSMKLLLKAKGEFVESLKVVIKEEQLPEFFKLLVDNVDVTVRSMSDSKYRSILKIIVEYSDKLLIDAALIFDNKEYGSLTPEFINQLIVRLAEIDVGDTVLDPTLGSGGTLVDALLEEPMRVVGQDINTTNAILSSVKLKVYGAIGAQVYLGDSLLSPQYNLKEKFDRVIQVPPFGLKIDTNLSIKLADDEYGRFPFGRLSRSSGDWAFISNAITSLKNDGKAVIVVPNGALFRGGPDKLIRKSILNFDFVESVISLPAGLFENTAIPTSILVFNTNKDENIKRQIQFIKVTDEMVSSVNRRERVLAETVLNRIVSIYKSKKNISEFSKNINIKDIEDANLSVDEYVFPNTYEMNGMKFNVDFSRLDKNNTNRLGDIADIGRGFNLTRISENDKGDYRVIKISDIGSNGINFNNLTRATADGSKVDNYLVHKGDLLLSIRGTVNKIGFVDRNDAKILLNANLVRIRTKKEYDSEWLKLYFESPMAQILLAKMAKGTGIKQISVVELRKFPIPILTLEQQINSVNSFNSAIGGIQKKMDELDRQTSKIKKDAYEKMGVSSAFRVIEN